MASGITLSLLLVFSLAVFLVLCKVIKSHALFFKSIILGLAAFFVSTFLHYVLPGMLFPILPWLATPFMQSFFLTAFIEDGIRFLCLRIVRQKDTLQTAFLLMVIALVFAVLESCYYWNTQSGLLFISLRLLGALPLHLGNAFLMATIPSFGLFLSIFFHGLYNYFLAIHAPFIMPLGVLMLILLIASVRYKQLIIEKTPPTISYF